LQACNGIHSNQVRGLGRQPEADKILSGSQNPGSIVFGQERDSSVAIVLLK